MNSHGLVYCLFSNRSINVCCADSFTPLKVLKGHKTEVNAVSWSPDGTMLASCSDDGTAKIWTMEEGLKFDLVGHSKEIFNIKWTPTGPGSANPEKPLYLCSASFDGSVKVNKLDINHNFCIVNSVRSMDDARAIIKEPCDFVIL